MSKTAPYIKYMNTSKLHHTIMFYENNVNIEEMFYCLTKQLLQDWSLFYVVDKKLNINFKRQKRFEELVRMLFLHFTYKVPPSCNVYVSSVYNYM